MKLILIVVCVLAAPLSFSRGFGNLESAKINKNGDYELKCFENNKRWSETSSLEAVKNNQFCTRRVEISSGIFKSKNSKCYLDVKTIHEKKKLTVEITPLQDCDSLIKKEITLYDCGFGACKNLSLIHISEPTRPY